MNEAGEMCPHCGETIPPDAVPCVHDDEMGERLAFCSEHCAAEYFAFWAAEIGGEA